MSSTPVTINGALVAFDPLILKGDPGTAAGPGPAGPAGPATNLTVGTVTTVPSDQAASVSITGTPPNQVVNFVIPTGADSGGGFDPDADPVVIGDGASASDPGGGAIGAGATSTIAKHYALGTSDSTIDVPGRIVVNPANGIFFAAANSNNFNIQSGGNVAIDDDGALILSGTGDGDNAVVALGQLYYEVGAVKKPIYPVDSTAPSTQAFGDAAAAGSAEFTSHRDHKHAMPAAPSTTLTGDATGSGTGSVATTVVKINGTTLSGLATGYIRNTTSTGVPTIGPVGTTITVSSNTYTPNCDTTDVALITSASANFTVVNPTGTARDGQKLMIRVKSGATGYTPTWGTAYASSGIATLPSGAFANSKTCTLGFIYDSAAAKWVLLGLDATGY